MSDRTYDAIREQFGIDVELPTNSENLNILWVYVNVLNGMADASEILKGEDYIDLLETIASEAQRRADFAKLVERLPDTDGLLGDLVRGEMDRRNTD